MKLSTAFKLALARVMRSRNLGRIETAGEETRSVDITYIKRNGEEITRTIYPYETKPHRTSGTLMVYAQDEGGSPAAIKSFIASRIRSVSRPKDPFEPEYPIQYGEQTDEETQ